MIFSLLSSYYFFSFVIAPIWYIIKVILSNELSVYEIWILYWIISLITLIAWFNDFWMTESLYKFLPQYITEKRYDKVKEILLYALWTQLVTAIIIFFIFYFWSNYIWINYFKSEIAIETLKIFSFFFVFSNIFQVISTFFLAIQNTFLTKLIDFIRMISILVFTLSIFFLWKWNIINYSYSWLIWLCIWIIFSYIIFYHKYYKIYLKWVKITTDFEHYKTIFKYAILVFLWAQAWTILWQMDMQMIIYLLWTEDAWYYTNYLSLMWIPFLIIAPIFSLLFPVFSEMNSKWETKKIKLVKNIFEKNFLSLWIAFNVLLFIFWEVIAYIFFWEKFLMSWTIIKYSALFLVFNFLLQVNFSIMASIWKVKERLHIILYALALNFVLNLIFINLFWVVWSALATWIGWIFIRFMSEKKLWKDYSTSYDFIYIFKNILLLVGMWIIVYLVLPKNIILISRLTLFFEVMIISAIYFLIYLIFNYKDFKYFIWEIKKAKQK